MQRVFTCVLAIGWVVVHPGWAVGLDAAQPVRGSRVRVELVGEARALTGRLVRLDSESLTVSMNDGAHEVPRGQIRRFEVSGGRSSRWKRAAVGAGIGVASGVPAAAFTGEWHITGPLALFGAVIGFSLPSRERWNAVDIRGVEVRCSPFTDGRRGMAVSISF